MRSVSKIRMASGQETPAKVQRSPSSVLEEERLRGGQEVDDSSFYIVVRWCEGRGERGPADIVASCNFEGPGHGRGQGPGNPQASGPWKRRVEGFMSGRRPRVCGHFVPFFAEGASSDDVMGMGEETSTGDSSVPSFKGPVWERTEAGTSTRDVESPSNTDVHTI